MLNIIKDINFTYYDENGYIYTFSINKNKKELLPNGELEAFMLCNETNTSANGEIFLRLKVIDDELFFRTDYFANSTEFIKLTLDEKASSSEYKIYSIDFGKDTFELKVLF